MPSLRQFRKMACIYFQWGLPLKTASRRAALITSGSVWSSRTVLVRSSISKGVKSRPSSCWKVSTKSLMTFPLAGALCAFPCDWASKISSKRSRAMVASKMASISPLSSMVRYWRSPLVVKLDIIRLTSVTVFPRWLAIWLGVKASWPVVFWRKKNCQTK